MSRLLLIKNARVWTEPETEPIENGSVLIEDGRIRRVGRVTARAETVIDADGCLVMPGLVQTHVHLCQCLFRGLAEDLPLLPWLKRYIWPLEAAHDEESLKTSALLACAEMIRSGTTAFLSMETVRHTHAVFGAVQQSGLMGVIGHCLMDETADYAPLAVEWEEALAYCEDLFEAWGTHERLRPALAPRFALSCSEANLRHAAGYARDRGLLLHTHAAEQVPEVEWVRQQTGLTNIEYLDRVGLAGPDVCLAHCIQVGERERALMAERDTRVLHCPSANLKLGSGVAPVPEYLNAGLTVSLGADGSPCNNRMDLFTEMREAALMQKPRLGPDALSAREVVRMATASGARTLGWGGEMGVLKGGMRANLIFVDPSGLHVWPGSDPATDLVYAHRADDVVLTMVNGEILFEDDHVTTIDEQQLRADALQQRQRVLERAGLA
jgi:5-methylthioadenosine/S-adenosylhomocysteine deaminase